MMENEDPSSGVTGCQWVPGQPVMFGDIGASGMRANEWKEKTKKDGVGRIIKPQTEYR